MTDTPSLAEQGRRLLEDLSRKHVWRGCGIHIPEQCPICITGWVLTRQTTAEEQRAREAALAAVRAFLEATAQLERREQERLKRHRFDCHECQSLGVAVDEDGCCVMCGSDAALRSQGAEPTPEATAQREQERDELNTLLHFVGAIASLFPDGLVVPDDAIDAHLGFEALKSSANGTFVLFPKPRPALPQPPKEQP